MKINELLNSIELSKEEPVVEKVSSEKVDLTSITKTAEYLEKLSAPDRLIDELAKIAVLQDFMEKNSGWLSRTKSHWGAGSARLEAKAAAKEIEAAKYEKLTKERLEKAEKIREGMIGSTEGDFSKGLLLGGGATAAGALAYKYYTDKQKAANQGGYYGNA